MRPRVVVVGNGMAGFRFVQELLGADVEITVIGDEPGGAYNRAQLPNVLARTSRADSIELANEDWYAVRGVRLLTGVTACRIDRAVRRIKLADGSVVPYDVLVLATGSSPVIPPAIREGPCVLAFHTLADCAGIQARAVTARHVVVLGGGVLGLETACGLAAGGVPVTLVQRGARLMERQLDSGAARVLARTVRAAGVTVLTGTRVREVSGTRLHLGDGRSLTADLVAVCCGTRPRADLAREAGLAVGAGVIVDDQMHTSDPGIFAIGDCAEHRGRVYGLVAPAWAQARVAAQAVAGVQTAAGGQAGGLASGGQAAGGGQAVAYTGSPVVVRLKAAGIELASLGSARADRGAEVIRFTDASRGVYAKLVVRDGRLAGAILLGDTRTVGTLTQLFDRGAPLPADRASLLIGRRDAAPIADSPVTIPGHATICQCNGVTKAAICAAFSGGARGAGEIAARTRASTGCGTCRDAVEGIVAWLAAAEPAETEAVPA